MVLHLFGPWRNISDGPKEGRGNVFLLIQTLLTFWADRIWMFEIFEFGNFLHPKFLDFQVPRFQNSWISKSLGFQIPRSPHSQISRFLNFQRNSQIPTWPLSQRTQGSNTSQGPLLRSCSLAILESLFLWLCSLCCGCCSFLLIFCFFPRMFGGAGAGGRCAICLVAISVRKMWPIWLIHANSC